MNSQDVRMVGSIICGILYMFALTLALYHGNGIDGIWWMCWAAVLKLCQISADQKIYHDEAKTWMNEQ